MSRPEPAVYKRTGENGNADALQINLSDDKNDSILAVLFYFILVFSFSFIPEFRKKYHFCHYRLQSRQENIASHSYGKTIRRSYEQGIYEGISVA